MKKIGFLSFGHWSPSPQSGTRSAGDALLQSIDLAVAAEELGADGAYFRVHHFARQLASPFPLLAAVGAKTSKIEIGTAVIDMRRGGSRLLGLAPPVRLGEQLVETRLCLGAFLAGEDAFRELRAQLGDVRVDVESVVHVNLQCLNDGRPPPVVGGPGQGLREQPAEPAGGGADFAVAQRRRNWGHRPSLRRAD